MIKVRYGHEELYNTMKNFIFTLDWNKFVYLLLLAVCVCMKAYAQEAENSKSLDEPDAIESVKIRIKQDSGNVRSIIALLSVYADEDSLNRYPDNLGELIEYGFLYDPHLLIAPFSQTSLPKRGADVLLGNCDYLYFGSGWTKKEYPIDRPLVCTKPRLITGGFINVGYKDLRFETYEQIPDKLAKAIIELENNILKLNSSVRGFVSYAELSNCFITARIRSPGPQLEEQYNFKFPIVEYKVISYAEKNITERTSISLPLKKNEISLLLDVFNIIVKDNLFEYKTLLTDKSLKAQLVDARYEFSVYGKKHSIKIKNAISSDIYIFTYKLEILQALIRNRAGLPLTSSSPSAND